MRTQNSNSLRNASLECKQCKYKAFINDWQNYFIKKIKDKTGRSKTGFNLDDAIAKSGDYVSKKDKVMIKWYKFINTKPLQKNDYYKYLNSYKKGKKLNEKYFKHDINLLHELYEKIDEDKSYTFFRESDWEKYVLYMLFVFNNLYKPQKINDIFNVKIKDNREYNPLTNLTRSLRGILPNSLKLVEYDISRANPSFIDLELNIERNEDIYSLIDKNTFSTLINSHNLLKINKSKILKQLEPIYGNRTKEVITENRFNNKGQMYIDMTAYEKKYINEFIQVNNIKKFVRLHDAVYIEANQEITTSIFDKIVKFKKKNVEPPTVINDKKLFYSFDNKGNVITSPVGYKDFLEQENFVRVTEENNDTITLFQDSNNVVKPFNYKTDTVSFLSKNIVEFDTKAVENKLAKDNNKYIKDCFPLISPKPLYYHRDTKNTFGIPFKNGFCKLIRGETTIEFLNYKDVKGFFPEHNTQKRNFEFEEQPEMSVFQRFLTMISVKKDPTCEYLTDEEKNILFLFTNMIGYMCYTYKSLSFNPCIILSDHDADDINRNGGRGKTIILNALGEVHKMMMSGGNEFDPKYRHRFDSLDKSIKIFAIDDVPKNFNYNELYTNISGDITCEVKNKSQEIIGFKEAPKFIVTTNWAVPYFEDATSTNRRFMEFKLTDYFNIENTPKKVFGHELFTDWDSQEWNNFYNFIFCCVKSYLESGLKCPQYDKDLDNYRAYFSNDSIENEFERIFDIVKQNNDNFFNVSDFLKEYKDLSNPLKNDKYFHQNNCKKLINIYLKHHKIKFEYISGEKKWRIESDDQEGFLNQVS